MHRIIPNLLRLSIPLTFCALHLSAFAGCPVPDSFTDNKDGTVSDRRAGLMWQRCPETTRWEAASNSCVDSAGGDKHNIAKGIDFSEALEAAKNSRYLGFSNWRLPSLSEMQSVLGKDCDRNTDGSPAASGALAQNLRRGASKDNPYYGTFWTSTMDPNNPSTKAMVVSLSTGWVMERERYRLPS